METSRRLPRAARPSPTPRFFNFAAAALFLFLLFKPCRASTQNSSISPPFSADLLTYIDNNGLFLLSPSKSFAFGFQKINPNDATSFLLVIVHMKTSRIVWTANPGVPLQNTDKFVFTKEGDAAFTSGDKVVRFANATGATQMLLNDTGNLVLLKGGGAGNDSSAGQILWQSFDHPTDTLLPGQLFKDGMALSAAAADGDSSEGTKWTYSLQAASADVRLLAGVQAPQQPYWSIIQDSNRNDIITGGGKGRVHSAVMSGNTWEFYDAKGVSLTQLQIRGGDTNASLAVVLDSSGFLNFYDLGSTATNPVDKVPRSACEMPGSCAPYKTCSDKGGSSSCGSCPVGLNCNLGVQPGSLCRDGGSAPSKFVDLGPVRYNPTAFVLPAANGDDLEACKSACSRNCTCRAAFFDGSTKECYLFDTVGSLQDEQRPSGSIPSRVLNCSIKTDSTGGSSNKALPVILGISAATAAVLAGIIYLGICYFHRKKMRAAPSRRDSSMGGLMSSDEDDFLGSISGAPVRYSYEDLMEATDNFSRKLGQGGFGSVYLGTLPDGTRVAVKKLESIGQGKKEFRAEVSIIGSIRHLHLVRLRGFCAEGTHRLLAYEFMANGSLDKWIFRRNAARSSAAIASSFASRSMESSNKGSGVFDPQQELPELDWDKRFSIALGTAKGLAYLHEDCEDKIVHCDIKPENVLLDDHFQAKVSDFGLAKLMTREQSHVFTTMRGTRGYLAPEWITCAPISEKSDVYSYGIVLLELVAGRKNFEPTLTSEKAHLPSYAFRMMEEGKVNEVFDDCLRRLGEKDERVELAVKVALWCVQEDMAMRPSMSKVVQMLEGVAPVPRPPMSSTLGSRIHASIYKTFSDGTTSSSTVPSDCNSDVLLSAVRLSGPR